MVEDIDDDDDVGGTFFGQMLHAIMVVVGKWIVGGASDTSCLAGRPVLCGDIARARKKHKSKWQRMASSVSIASLNQMNYLIVALL